MDEIDLNSIPFITPVILSLGLLIVGPNKKWKKPPEFVHWDNKKTTDSSRHPYPTAQKLPCCVVAMFRSLMCFVWQWIEQTKLWEQGKTGEWLAWNVQKIPNRRLNMRRMCGGPLHAGYGPWLLFLGCEAGWCYGGCCCMPATFSHRAACCWPWRKVQSINSIISYTLWKDCL